MRGAPTKVVNLGSTLKWGKATSPDAGHLFSLLIWVEQNRRVIGGAVRLTKLHLFFKERHCVCALAAAAKKSISLAT